ncbi:hypothetical protein [Fulvivirga sp.]|uniref:hypothetical protein n=1 Tax=Fulvivirga sp. TaxID=1931237 RepID=UPI0032EC5AD6
MKKPFRIKLTIIVSIIFYLIVKLDAVWSRALTTRWNSIIFLTGILLCIVLVVLFLYSFAKLFLDSNFKRRKSYLPIIIIPVIFFDASFDPLNIDLDRIYGKIQYKAYYEGSMSGATFTLREKNRFEIYYTSAPFSRNYWRGEYKQDGDTLYLEYNGIDPFFNTGKKALLINGRGVVLSKPDNTFDKFPRPFFWEVKLSN